MVIFLFMYKFRFGSVARSSMSNVEDKSNCFSSIGFSRKVGENIIKIINMSLVECMCICM